jgi:Ca-activated chloride channel family protein
MKQHRYTFMGNDARNVGRHRCMTELQKTVNKSPNWLRCRKTKNNALAFLTLERNLPLSLYKIVLPVFLCTVLLFSDVGSSMRKGNHLYRKGEYENALQSYQEALVQEPDNPAIHYNIARALYKMEQYDEAIGEFQMGLLNKDRNFQADVLYNIGNCNFKKGKLDAAIDMYKNSLLLDHKDTQAKQNLELCLKIKEQMENQAQNDSTGQQQNQEQQEQQQQQPRKTEMSQEEAERILQALQNKEQQNMERVKEQEKKEHVDKDW